MINHYAGLNAKGSIQFRQGAEIKWFCVTATKQQGNFCRDIQRLTFK
jgi:hypothetical protein